MSPKPKDEALRFRISEADYELLKRAADRSSPLAMTVTAFVLSAALERARPGTSQGSKLAGLRSVPLKKSMHLLVAHDDKVVLKRAAEKASLSLTDFIVSAALEKARTHHRR